MAYLTTTLLTENFRSREFLEALKREFPEWRRVDIVASTDSPYPKMLIEVPDYGIWEWNEEVISDGSGSTAG